MGLYVVLGKPHAIALGIREILEPDPENMSHSIFKWPISQPVISFLLSSQIICLRETKGPAFFWTPQVMGCPAEAAGLTFHPSPLSMLIGVSHMAALWKILSAKKIRHFEEDFLFVCLLFLSFYQLIWSKILAMFRWKWMESLRLKYWRLMKGASLHLGHIWLNRECCSSSWVCFSQVCVVVSGGLFLSSTSERVWRKKKCVCFAAFPKPLHSQCWSLYQKQNIKTKQATIYTRTTLLLLRTCFL